MQSEKTPIDVLKNLNKITKARWIRTQANMLFSGLQSNTLLHAATETDQQNNTLNNPFMTWFKWVTLVTLCSLKKHQL